MSFPRIFGKYCGQLYYRVNFTTLVGGITLISGIFRLDCGLYQFTDNVIIIGFFCHVLGMVTTVHSPSPRRVRDPRILNIGITCLWDKLECVYFWFKVPLFRMQSVRVAIKLPTRNIIYIAPLYIITPPLQQLQHNTATNCSGEINWQNVNSSVLQFGHRYCDEYIIIREGVPLYTLCTSCDWHLLCPPIQPTQAEQLFCTAIPKGSLVSKDV